MKLNSTTILSMIVIIINLISVAVVGIPYIKENRFDGLSKIIIAYIAILLTVIVWAIVKII